MADPIETAQAYEARVKKLTDDFVRARKRIGLDTTTGKTERVPTLFESYRETSRGESFGTWLKGRGLPCA